MRIFYDGFIYGIQRAGGINRYFAEIISGLPSDYHPVVAGVRNFGNNAPSHPNLEKCRFKLFRPRRLSAQLRDKWWKPHVLGRIDILHPTYYELTRGFAWADFKCPIVLTVHDFIYSTYSNLIEGSETVISHQSEAIQKADFVICVSKATERDLLERFPEKQGKTSVIYHGSSFEIQPPLTDREIFESPSFLFVGGRSAYKNFAFLLGAFAKASRSNLRIRLRVVGAPFTTDEMWQIHLLGISDRVDLFVYPDEQQLMDLYRSSVALVYPSLHEGFGIPPLEAMACGTLAITGNTSSLPEVVGNGGIMLDPCREDDWVECLLNVAKGGGDRDILLKLGRERVGGFSWKDTVVKHLEVYRNCLS